MSNIDTKQLKINLLALIRDKVASDGFTFKAGKDLFVRQHNGICDMFQLVFLNAKPGWYVQPNVGVRIDRVENIFHMTSGFEAKYQKDTPTIGGSIGNIRGNSNRDCEFLLESESQVDTIACKIISEYNHFALLYFNKFSSLTAIDEELNNDPNESNVNRVSTWLRCSTGTIVARLVERKNFDELVEKYRDILSHTDKGFYLARFQNLVESLKGSI